MRVFKYSLLAASAVAWMVLLAACATTGGNTKDGLQTVGSVDLNRYAGKWYEIARYPNSFQRQCWISTATYHVRGDGELEVVNACRDGGIDGEETRIEGRAWVVEKSTNAKLKVRFVWPFSGNYWIIDLGKDYEYAVVGEPSRDYLWILSRTPTMDANVYASITDRLKQSGYDPARLIRQ